jgi:hypothetical protein
MLSVIELSQMYDLENESLFWDHLSQYSYVTMDDNTYYVAYTLLYNDVLQTTTKF